MVSVLRLLLVAAACLAVRLRLALQRRNRAVSSAAVAVHLVEAVSQRELSALFVSAITFNNCSFASKPVSFGSLGGAGATSQGSTFNTPQRLAIQCLFRGFIHLLSVPPFHSSVDRVALVV